MRLRFSQLFATAACLSLLLAAFSATSSAKAATEDYSLIYPTPDQLFGPRIYGKGEPPKKAILLFTPFPFSLDGQSYRELYQPLMNFAYSGEALLDIRVTGQHQAAFPVYLAAHCVAPISMPKFLYDVSKQEKQLFYETQLDIDTALIRLALSDPIFRPQGMTAENFERRMRWCMAQREAGIIAEETQRLRTVYDFGLQRGGVSGMAVIVNDKAHEWPVYPQKILQEMK